ncbi:MAG: anti-sigma-F factor Fin [Bacillota bacterium]
MHIRYYCSHCHDLIAEIEMDYLDEERLGISSLTEDERDTIIRYDERGRLCLYAICDTCSDGLTEVEARAELAKAPIQRILH